MKRNPRQSSRRGLLAIGTSLVLGTAGCATDPGTGTEETLPGQDKPQTKAADSDSLSESNTADTTQKKDSPSETSTNTPSVGERLQAAPTESWTNSLMWPVEDILSTGRQAIVLTAPKDGSNEGRIHLLKTATGKTQASFESSHRPWGVVVDRARSLATVYAHRLKPSGPGQLLRIDMAEGDMEPIHEFNGFPFVVPFQWFDGNVLLLATRNRDQPRLLSVDVPSDSVDWSRTLNGSALYPGILDDRLYVTTASDDGGTLQAISQDTGKTVWSDSLSQAPALPRVTETGIYISSRLRPTAGTSSGKTGMLWKYEQDGTRSWDVELTLTPRQNVDYTDAGAVSVVGLDGTQTNPKQATVYSLAGEKLFQPTFSGDIREMELSESIAHVWTDDAFATYEIPSGSSLATLETGPVTYPEIVEELVLFPGPEGLSAIDSRSGTEHWRHGLNGEISFVRRTGNRLYAGHGSKLTALEFPAGADLHSPPGE